MNDESPIGQLARFLSLSDAAELLSVSTKQAYALVHSGELPAIQVGAARLWRIERSVMEAYIEARYEESRRHALWNQADFANVTAFSFRDL